MRICGIICPAHETINQRSNRMPEVKHTPSAKWRMALPAALLLLALCVSPVFAAFSPGGGAGSPTPGAGGFTGPGPGLTTAKEASSMWDDTPVSLEGYIVQSLGGERYLFKDDSGTITLEIDQEIWRGQTITPQDKVRIQGEVDTELRSVKIDVEYITKI
jgi:uncharacterized protein (TIGR00156 family)